MIATQNTTAGLVHDRNRNDGNAIASIDQRIASPPPSRRGGGN